MKQKNSENEITLKDLEEVNGGIHVPIVAKTHKDFNNDVITSLKDPN